jgi:uncharacterized damage-inducible protein DinB
MLTHIKNLVAHKGDVTDVLMKEVLASDSATADGEILALCNHILISNRFWSAAIRGVPFDLRLDREMQVERAPEAFPAALWEVQEEEVAWLETATEADCLRRIAHPLIPGGGCSVAEAFAQVCLHTHGHRAQLMKALRRHGVAPAPHDFIAWLANRALGGQVR